MAESLHCSPETITMLFVNCLCSNSKNIYTFKGRPYKYLSTYLSLSSICLLSTYLSTYPPIYLNTKLMLSDFLPGGERD